MIKQHKRMKGEWFESWFDSPYYHILYRNRDEQEARQFIDKLIDYLDPSPEAAMLDVACGKGRHSRYLAEKGFYVTGIDLSVANIQHALQFETPKLTFYTHDMRLIFRINYYDYVFNFFTSFGYFDSDKDHFNTIKNMTNGMKKNGRLVIDFLNARKAISELVPEREKVVDGIKFRLESVYENGFIRKIISFEDGGNVHHFEEQVRAFRLEDFERFFERAGLRIVALFGNYQLEKYNENISERLILVAGKK